MAAFQPGTHVNPAGNIYQVLGNQYLLPAVPAVEARNPVQVFQNQNVPLVKTAVANPAGFGVVNHPLPNGGFHGQPRPPVNMDQIYFITPAEASANGPVYNNIKVIPRGNPVLIQNGQTNPVTLPQQGILNVHVNGNRSVQQKPKPLEGALKGLLKIPEPKKVKIGTEKRQKLGNLMIYISESFLSWDISGKTILDLNFMRYLFNITTVGIIIQKGVKYEDGICSAIKKIIHNKLLSDWLILKCEEKEIPFFKVNNQIEVYSVSSFTTLLNIIAQESCLPLPFIISDQTKNIRYFYINFPLKSNDRVKKLSTCVFHDVDNGRKKLLCKYPGIRLDCNFGRTFQRFVIHVHRSAVPAYEVSVTYIRQLIIYNHIVWGFLQAWIRKIREQYNGCFKLEDIASNLSLCQGELPANKTNEIDMVYSIDYGNLYLKFDPVTLKETTTSFTIENFETNFVCDVTIVQYYRQFFLINDMHYSDALKNISLFSQRHQENTAKNPTEFDSTLQQQDKVSVGSLPPDGIRKVSQPIVPPDNNNSNNANQCENLPNDKHSSNGENIAKTVSNPVSQDSVPKQPLTKPLLKTRTVEEINSSIDKLRNIDAPFEIDLNWNDTASNLSELPTFICDSLKHCYLKNSIDISDEDETNDSKKISAIFHEALKKAMNETNTSDAFIESLYLSLQLHFTNATCQNILNKVITKAIVKKFPYLRSILNTSIDPNGNHEDATAAPPLVEELSKIRTIYSDSVELANGQMGANVVDQTVNKPPATHCDPQEIQILKPYQNCPVIQQESQPILVINSGGVLFKPTDVPAPASEPNPDSRIPNAEKPKESPSRDPKIFQRTRRRYISKKKLSSSKRMAISKPTPMQLEHNYGLPEIPKMPRLVPFSELMTPNGDETVARNQTTCERREMSVQTDDSSLSEAESEKAEDRTKVKMKKYNIKPCTVKLDKSEVTNYLKRLKEKSSEDEETEPETRSKKKAKKVSDLMYMEARTRVLQRLRKRREMLVSNGDSGRTVYTADELDEFVVRRKCTLNLTSYKEYSDDEFESYEDEVEDGNSAEEEGEEKSQEEEPPPLKELRVVLTRLEDTPEFRHIRKCDEATAAECSKDGDSNFTDCKGIPRNKRKYFELRDGKLYLKEQYHVRNGTIVPVDSAEKGESRVNIKNEPDPAQEGPSTAIKRENSVI